jgi:hypothetical protein
VNTTRDQSSIETIVAALYDCISGPAGVEREWQRLQRLFYPGARLLRTVVSPDGKVSLTEMDIAAFRRFAEPYFCSNAFYEREIARRVDRFGQIAQVFSSYESSSAPDGTGPLGRGINSIQLWNDGQRWWVMSMLWDDERPGLRVPAEYLVPAHS